jgi:hypothetical protein
MEYWSAGVLRQFGIAPRVRGVGTAFRAICVGSQPRAKALAILFSHFMADALCALTFPPRPHPPYLRKSPFICGWSLFRVHSCPFAACRAVGPAEADAFAVAIPLPGRPADIVPEGRRGPSRLGRRARANKDPAAFGALTARYRLDRIG